MLYLVRHGVALPTGTPGIADDDRPLTPEGARKVREVGRGLAALEVRVDRIVTSPLPRARRTAAILAQVLGITDVLEENEVLRAGRSAETIRTWLLGQPERRMMLVGHDPAFSDLVGLLPTGQVGRPICGLRKGGVACLDKSEGEYWSIVWIARPRILRRLGG